MKLVRYGKAGEEKPGLIDDDGNLRDLSRKVDDISGDFLSDKNLKMLRELNVNKLKKVEGRQRFGPCVGSVGKFLAIGLNYTDHAEEAGMAIPEHPILFSKATSCIIGPNDTVSMPRGSKTCDWEVELGIIIGKKTKYVTPEKALRSVAGYCVSNDVSERTFQAKLSGQWTKGKSCDTFGPLGPWLVTRDEVKDPQNLSMYLDVNGKRMQSGTTAKMIFSVAEIISHLSQLMTLYPGDVIITGTPPGVGMGMKPKPKYLKVGDVMEVGIEGLGVQKQKVKQDK